MLKIYNSLTRKKEIFKPLKNKKVNLFVCGPTTYDLSHIGHARTYISFDVIVKYLKHKGFNVFYLQNITDIDDKIIQRAKEKKIEAKDLAKNFEEEYLKDMKTLKVDSVTKYARATDHIKEIIDQVGRLLEKRYAYKTRDGIYYDISKFKDYGKLSGRTALQSEDAVSRIDESKNKKHKGDFALWKKSKPEEPKWDSPLGKGRPGWHIEDTAITEKYFGPQYDIHGGARDLIFPHHQAEIAQMEALSGKSPMAKYWMHGGFLTVSGQKMGKSLGNFITLNDILKRYPKNYLRFFIVKSLWRSSVDYSESVMIEIKSAVEKIEEFLRKIKSVKSNKSSKKSDIEIKKLKENFYKELEDDFNTPKAFAVMFNLISKVSALLDKNEISKKQSSNIYKFFQEINKIFGIINFKKINKTIPAEIKKLVKIREQYRNSKDWQKADETRLQIEKQGFIVEDTKFGPTAKSV